MNLETTPVIPPEFRGTCTGVCRDKHGFDVVLTDTWTYYEVRWDDPRLAQQGWGTPAPFDPTQLTALHLQALWSPGPFDIYIDEVRFLAR